MTTLGDQSLVAIHFIKGPLDAFCLRMYIALGHSDATVTCNPRKGVFVGFRGKFCECCVPQNVRHKKVSPLTPAELWRAVFFAVP